MRERTRTGNLLVRNYAGKERTSLMEAAAEINASARPATL
jgi:hypothetical protein